CGQGGLDVGQHPVDVSELITGEIFGCNVRGQPGLNQLKISCVPAVRAVPLIPHRDVVVPEATFKNPCSIIEHVLEIKITGIECHWVVLPFVSITSTDNLSAERDQYAPVDRWRFHENDQQTQGFSRAIWWRCVTL